MQTDVLSQVLATCRSERAVTARFTLSAPWALASAGVEGLLIRVCSGEPYWIRCGDAPPLRVAPRDIVMLPHGTAHTVSSAPDVPPIAFRTLIAAHSRGRHGDHPIVFAYGGGGALTELFALHLWMPAVRGTPLLSSLPPLVLLRESDIASTASLAFATAALVNETLAQRPGWQLVAARMADLLLVHLLREHLAQATSPASGWLRGLQDAGIGRAVACMHAQPEQAWTVASLASACHVSRSVFSARFRSVMQTTPMQYLASLRMALAADRFHDGAAQVAKVAASVGYTSEKSFARAFQRWAGMTPSAYLKSRTLDAQIRRLGG